MPLFLAVILIATWSAPGVKPFTQEQTVASMEACKTAEGVTKLIAYFDGMSVKTECREEK